MTDICLLPATADRPRLIRMGTSAAQDEAGWRIADIVIKAIDAEFYSEDAPPNRYLVILRQESVSVRCVVANYPSNKVKRFPSMAGYPYYRRMRDFVARQMTQRHSGVKFPSVRVSYSKYEHPDPYKINNDAGVGLLSIDATFVC